MWFILSLWWAITQSLNFALTKRILKKANEYTTGMWLYFISFIITFILSATIWFPNFGENFIYYVLILGIVNWAAALLNLKALQICDLSLAVPIISFSPIFSIFISYFMFWEIPSIYWTFWILLVVWWSYLLNFSRKNKNILEPFKLLFTNRWTLLMLMVAFLFSITMNLFKLVVINSDFLIGPSICYFIMWIMFMIANYFLPNNNINFLKKNWLGVLSISLLMLSSDILISMALKMQFVTYVMSIKRLSILFSVLIGIFFFKEWSIKKRIIASIVMLSWVITILFFQ